MNSAHTGQSRPDYGLGVGQFQYESLQNMYGVSSRSVAVTGGWYLVVGVRVQGLPPSRVSQGLGTLVRKLRSPSRGPGPW